MAEGIWHNGQAYNRCADSGCPERELCNFCKQFEIQDICAYLVRLVPFESFGVKGILLSEETVEKIRILGGRILYSAAHLLLPHIDFNSKIWYTKM